MTIFIRTGLIIAIAIVPAVARAQGGGASQTGAVLINVTGPAGVPLPGVTLTLRGGSPPQVITTVTPAAGPVRVPGMPVGEYELVAEMTGMRTTTRAILVTIGFTATVDIVMRMSSLADHVSVIAPEVPLIDRVSTRVNQSFRRDRLGELPTARDEWSLLALTPGVIMQQAGVAGSRSGRVTPSSVYGFGTQDSQTRVLVEGINITEGTSRSGVYLDFGAHEEAFVGTAAQGAEMPTAGLHTQFVSRSGGNRFSGEIYGDVETSRTQATNLPKAWLEPAAFNGAPLRRNSNRVDAHHEINFGAGGPLRHDRAWGYLSARRLSRSFQQGAFAFDDTQQINLWNATGKGTYQVNPANRVIAFYQWQQKVEPRLPHSIAVVFTSAADTARQDSGSWVWKGEWNHVAAGRAFTEVRYGEYGYYFPWYGESDAPFRIDGPRRFTEGGDARTQQDRGRRQLTAASSWMTQGGGLHWLRAGVEVDRDTFWRGVERIRAGNIQHQFNNGLADRVTFGFPTADGPIGGKNAHDHLLSVARLDRVSGFVSDEWTVVPRVTLNAGVRFDRYHGWAPEQQQLGGTTGPVTVPAMQFPETTFVVWNGIAPRLGMAWDVAGNGRTVIKAFYGLFGHNPGTDLPSRANPNQSTKSITYQWTDTNLNRLYDPGEEGNLLMSALSTAIAVDPALRQPRSREWTAFVERELDVVTALRAGVVQKSSRELWQAYRPGRPPSAYTVPFTVDDIGADGLAGTADDEQRTFLGVPQSQVEMFPITQVVQNVPAVARYTSAEAQLERRARGRWSLSLSAVWTWSREHSHWTLSGNRVTGEIDTFPAYFPNSPNDTSLQEYTTWSVKGFGTYLAPWRVSVVPVFRHQAGQPYGRTFTATAPPGSGAVFSGLVLVEPLGHRRSDNITLADIRIMRPLTFGRVSVMLMADVFNVFNSHAVQGLGFMTGANFERPLSVVAPRTLRLSARAVW